MTKEAERITLGEDEIHPNALGVAKSEGSPYVRQLGANRLSTTHVLTLRAPYVADIRTLSRDRHRRPPVFCPFCGRRGSYHLTDDRHHFSHASGNDDCVNGDLETVLHRRAKALLREEFTKARSAGGPIRVLLPCHRCKKSKQKSILEARHWSSEEEEHSVVGLRLDVATLAEDHVAAAFEVRVSHAVPDLKIERLEAAKIPGIELLATDLIHKVTGEALWRSDSPLPTPLRSWLLEAPPRSRTLCTTCRSGQERATPAARLITEWARRDPVEWKAVCGSLPDEGDEIKQALVASEDPGKIILRAYNPEGEETGGPDLPDPVGIKPLDLLSKILRRYVTRRFGDQAWKGAKLIPDPHRFLIERVREFAADFDQRREEWDEERLQFLEMLRFADEILQIIGREESTSRWEAWLGFGLLVGASRFGNTVLPIGMLRKYPGSLMPSPDHHKIASVARSLAESDLVRHRRNGGQIGLAHLVSLESRCAQIIIEFASTRFADAEVRFHRNLGRVQTRVLSAIRDRRLLVLTGGAGTGKTTAVHEVLRAPPNLRWILLAPTGKAAQRLGQKVRGAHNVSDILTVAKFLHSDEYIEYDRPAPFSAVVIDEVGFLGIEQLAKLLWKLIREQPKRLVLVGDPNQLPSIGPGNALLDIIQFADQHPSVIAKIELTVNHRSKDNDIAPLATSLRTASAWPYSRDYAGVEVVAPRSGFAREVTQVYLDLRKSGDTQVIAPTRELVEKINEALQRRVNPGAPHLRTTERLCLGDRVVCTKNYYSKSANLMNGFIATIQDETDEHVCLEEEGGGTVKLPALETGRLSLGYAITIHKAQGSEWENTIVAIPPSLGSFVNRLTLYTAITRARSRLVIVADKDTLNTALRQPAFRYTSLQEALAEELLARRTRRLLAQRQAPTTSAQR